MDEFDDYNEVEEEIDHEEEEEHKEKPKKGKRRPKKDPNAPKRGKSAYMFFCADVRESVVEQHPDKKMTDISKILGAKWKELSDEAKKPYDQMAKEDKARYEREKESYVPDDDYAAAGTTKTKKKKKDPNAPKRPLSAYFLFQKAKRAEIKEANPDFGLGDIAKALGEQWKQLSEEEKKPYTDEAATLKAEYDVVLKKYKESLSK